MSLYPARTETFSKDASNARQGSGYDFYALYGSGAASYNASFTAASALNASTTMRTHQRANFSYVQSTGGQWYGVGVNTDGQLGMGDLVNRTTYTLNSAMTGSTLVVPGPTSLFVIKGGLLYAAGKNTSGQLGFPDTSIQNASTLTLVSP